MTLKSTLAALADDMDDLAERTGYSAPLLKAAREFRRIDALVNELTARAEAAERTKEQAVAEVERLKRELTLTAWNP